MARPRSLALVTALCLGAASAVADGLPEEVMLHPMDGFTADTLPAGQVIYNQSPMTLPMPSWMWVGLTDWLTVEIDLLPLVGGLVIEPHLPVPSANLRARLVEAVGWRPGLAVEVMGQHMWRPLDQERGAYRVTREGTHVWAHLNVSLRLHDRLRLHLSGGASWTHSIEFAMGDEPMGTLHRNLWSPDGSASLDWRPHRRWSFHLTGSHGTTFVYSDNQPRKWEVAYGFRVAPFLDARHGFLRTLRMEFPAIVTQYRDLGTGVRAWVPVLPYLYWQFGGDS